MRLAVDQCQPNRAEKIFITLVVALCLGFHLWGVHVGWTSKNLPGVEFRQAQTALSAYFIQRDSDFSPAYPTPVLGKPWSIPMEFPLYQWTVVVTSDATGLGLVKSGRLVSIVCFYLMLPAVYLLLGRWNVAGLRRWLIVATALSCPLYIFYTRAFLGETMALMFSAWFWFAFSVAVERRSGWWLALTSFTGMCAGLVKITTFMLYCLPVAIWAVRRLRAGRQNGQWRRDLTWMAAAVLVPFVSSYWWISFADAVKAQNPLAWFLSSEHLRGFNLGVWSTRFSPAMWAMKARFVHESLTSFYAMSLCAMVAVVAARHRWREIVLCVAVFLAALVIFPELYAIHEYYYVENTLLLIMAMGLALVGLAESRHPRWVFVAVTIGVAGGQMFHYVRHYFPQQRGISPGGDGLTNAIGELTKPDDVIAIFGQDWNSMIPYYAGRRAIMFRDEENRDTPRLRQALANLRGERIGALIVTDSNSSTVEVQEWFVKLGLDARPLFRWRNFTVYLPAESRTEAAHRLHSTRDPEIQLAPGAEPPPEWLASKWYETGLLPAAQKDRFKWMTPAPVRFFSTYGPSLDTNGGKVEFNAHPTTRLVFRLPAGRHRLVTSVYFLEAAYDSSLPPDKTTDGVEITLSILDPERAGQVLYTRLLDPRRQPLDRGPQPVSVDFILDRAREVELYFGPGPRGYDARDWIKLNQLTIE